jgi:hypothetical protein
MSRTELQNDAWIFPDAMIGGRPCRVSPPRLAALHRFKNALITKEADFFDNPNAANEMAAVLSLPFEEVKRMIGMEQQERDDFCLFFGLDHEDEIVGALATINRKMKGVEAAAFEAVESPGKLPEAARQPQDGSPQSIGSPSATT